MVLNEKQNSKLKNVLIFILTHNDYNYYLIYKINGPYSII